MLEKTYRIGSFDVDPTGRVKLSALQKYMQQLAREDCDSYGATYPAMREAGMVFVITKLGIELEEPIFTGDIVTVRSVNNRLEGVHFVREFLFSKQGRPVVAASTYWVLLHFEKRSIVRPKLFPFPMVAYNLPIPGVEIPRRIFEMDETLPAPVGRRTVAYSDLDENNHLNNCVYSDISLDFAPADLQNAFLKKACINFQNEARQGETLEITVAREKNTPSFRVNAHNHSADRPCFEAEFIFNEQ